MSAPTGRGEPGVWIEELGGHILCAIVDIRARLEERRKEVSRLEIRLAIAEAMYAQWESRRPRQARTEP